MEKKQIMEKLAMAIINGDQDKARETAREALGSRIDPLEAVEEGLSKGMDTVGKRFESKEAYLPELLMAANAFKAAMEILKPEIEAKKEQVTKMGTVLIGTVKGDIHHIGKDIVATILEISGFKVVNIGVDNLALKIVQEAVKSEADVIALSSLMTTTMPGQKEVIEVLKEMNLRDKYFVIVGGGPVTQTWADEIGADGYGGSAVEAVEIARKLLDQRG